MQGRYFCFTIVVRVNQIEVAPGINVGVDERRENTVENLVKYRTAIAHTTAIAASLPIDVKDPDASAMILDTLAAESYYTVNDVLYELILGTKVVRDSESVKNLDIIFDGHIYDPGCIFGFGGFASKMLTQWKTPFLSFWKVCLYSGKIPFSRENSVEKSPEHAVGPQGSL